jgi:hypothetical protein
MISAPEIIGLVEQEIEQYVGTRCTHGNLTQ